MKTTLIQKGIYQHYKGNYYEVIDVAKHSETREELVIYRALYGEYRLWARPLTHFLEPIEIEGVKKPRFSFLKSQDNPLIPANTASTSQ
jgi:hypothetical protein